MKNINHFSLYPMGTYQSNQYPMDNKYESTFILTCTQWLHIIQSISNVKLPNFKWIV